MFSLNHCIRLNCNSIMTQMTVLHLKSIKSSKDPMLSNFNLSLTVFMQICQSLSSQTTPNDSQDRFRSSPNSPKQSSNASFSTKDLTPPNSSAASNKSLMTVCTCSPKGNWRLICSSWGTSCSIAARTVSDSAWCKQARRDSRSLSGSTLF